MPPSDTIQVTLTDQTTRTVATDTRVEEIVPGYYSDDGLPYVCALVNNDVQSLSSPLEVDCVVRPVSINETHGDRVYRRSVAFLLAKTIRELHPRGDFTVEHSIGPGLYCNFEEDESIGLTTEQLTTVEERMRELVTEDIPIVRTKIAFTDALERFRKEGQWDKYSLLRYRNSPAVVVYTCGNFSDLAHWVMAPRTGLLEYFRLIHYPPGFVLQFPDRDNPPHFSPFEKQPHLFNIFKEHKEWGRILGLTTVGQLNHIIAEGGIDEFVKISEALHEKKIARIADMVHERADSLHTLLIAGPTSAGKTTLSKRLRVQLRVNGLRPVTISADDYFVDRDKTPRHDDGSFDFEHLEAIDLDLFNKHLVALSRGEQIKLPFFNFESGRREYRGKTLRLERDEILILEGIHCLNPQLTQALPDEQKFKIYISCLGQLNLDKHNRISTTDNRLLRRMVRDHKFRGHSALTTLRMWHSVRRGEKTWIFPYQQQADIAFNAALEYELAVLKPLAEPMLAGVKSTEPEYANARRLLKLLGHFLTAADELVPTTSILREYIGKSGFEY